MRLSQINNPALNQGLQDQLSPTNPGGFFTKLLSTFVTAALIIGGVYFFFTLVLGAISWMSAGGDKTKVEEAQSKIRNALIGVFILFAVFAIVKFVESVFGIQILNINVGALRVV